MTGVTPPGIADRHVHQYLNRYAEAEARDCHVIKTYAHALVIPACRESASDVRATWAAVPGMSDCLVIVVINSPHPGDASSEELARELSAGRTTIATGSATRLVTGGSPDLLLVDRYTPGREIPPKQGVGLARKAGTDIALSLVDQGSITSRWLCTTDADARLPPDYFDFIPGDSDAALIQPFRHTPAAGLDIALRLYETNLLYPAAGLMWAGSPYAYPTVGSTLTFSGDDYARVRGFPRRSTGEDFYLLNKLRKLGLIRVLRKNPILLSGRLSDRVPVGTGRAIGAIDALANPTIDYRYEHPHCYTRLRQFLRHLEVLAAGDGRYSAPPDADLADYARRVNLEKHFMNRAAQRPGTEVMRTHLHEWFDALKTRQFIHHFRDHYFGSITIDELAVAPFVTAGREPGQIIDGLWQALTDRKW